MLGSSPCNQFLQPIGNNERLRVELNGRLRYLTYVLLPRLHLLHPSQKVKLHLNRACETLTMANLLPMIDHEECRT